MFWKISNTSSPHFEAILQKENVTLQELMEEDDIIQECKAQNKKLVDFLCKRNVLEELVTLITQEPSEEIDERIRFKYPNIACELLTCDVPALNESLSRDNELLEKLYSFIDKDPPLNPLLASFLSRTLGVLIVKRLDQAMGFLKDKENFISLLLKHLGTSAIMDLTLKLITEVGDVEHRHNLLNWLDSQNLVQSLVALFDPKVDSERHHNASQLICDVLRISREAMNDHRDRLDTDPILARLESPPIIGLMMEYMLGAEKSESSIVGGIQVLLALLGHKNSRFKSRWRVTDSFIDNNLAYNNTYDETEVERKQKVAQSTAMVIVARLKDFHQILLDPPKKPAVKTSLNTIDPPLGNTRLQITKLLAALIALNNAEILRELMRLGMIELLLDLFFKYVWNNFLHSQVQQCIAAALSAHVQPTNADTEATTSDNLMYPYLIIKCRLLDRVLEAWDDNEQKQTKPKGIRQGYMGHLINIANEIVLQCETNISLDNFIAENLSKDRLEAWSTFINHSLAETNKTQRVVLGGVHPSNLISDDSNDDYNIPQNAILHQQIYGNLQMQQMTPDIIENYGFHDEFNDPDDPIHDSLERRSNINLLNDSDLTRQEEMFKKVCSDYINTLDDADDVIFEEQGSSSRKNDSWDPRENCDEEENLPPEENRMDLDPWSNLENNRGVIPLLEPKDPWGSINPDNNAAQEDGWADFGNFSVTFTTASDFIKNSTHVFGVANTKDVHPSGNRQIEPSIQDITPDSNKIRDNHPAEPVPHPVDEDSTTPPPKSEPVEPTSTASAAGDSSGKDMETTVTSSSSPSEEPAVEAASAPPSENV